MRTYVNFLIIGFNEKGPKGPPCLLLLRGTFTWCHGLHGARGGSLVALSHHFIWVKAALQWQHIMRPRQTVLCERSFVESKASKDNNLMKSMCIHRIGLVPHKKGVVQKRPKRPPVMFIKGLIDTTDDHFLYCGGRISILPPLLTTHFFVHSKSL